MDCGTITAFREDDDVEGQIHLQMPVRINLRTVRGFATCDRDGQYVTFEAQADRAHYLGGTLRILDFRQSTVMAAWRYRTHRGDHRIDIGHEVMLQLNRSAWLAVYLRSNGGTDEPYVALTDVGRAHPRAALHQIDLVPHGETGRYELRMEISHPYWHFLSEGRDRFSRRCHGVIVALTDDANPLLVSHTDCIPAAPRGIDTLVCGDTLRLLSERELFDPTPPIRA